MGTGIIVCGLNGSGKTELGKALAKKLHYYFIDNEDLYFPKTNSRYMYESPRTDEEVEQILLNEIAKHENFVLASVKSAFESVTPNLKLAVVVSAPVEIRIKRIWTHSFEKFGDRMLPGGDLYEQEREFLELAGKRTVEYAEDWLKDFNGKIVRVDSTHGVGKCIKDILKGAKGAL